MVQLKKKRHYNMNQYHPSTRRTIRNIMDKSLRNFFKSMVLLNLSKISLKKNTQQSMNRKSSTHQSQESIHIMSDPELVASIVVYQAV